MSLVQSTTAIVAVKLYTSMREVVHEKRVQPTVSLVRRRRRGQLTTRTVGLGFVLSIHMACQYCTTSAIIELSNRTIRCSRSEPAFLCHQWNHSMRKWLTGVFCFSGVGLRVGSTGTAHVHMYPRRKTKPEWRRPCRRLRIPRSLRP